MKKQRMKLALYAAVGLYDKLREVVDDLVKRGELKQQEGHEILVEAKVHEQSRLKELQERVETSVGRAIERLPRPVTAKDLAPIEQRLQALESRLAELEAGALAHR